MGSVQTVKCTQLTAAATYCTVDGSDLIIGEEILYKESIDKYKHLVKLFF